MLIAYKTEKLVLDERKAESSPGGVAVQLRYFLVARDVRILVIEIRRRIQPIRSAMNVSAAVKRVRAGRGAHVDVSATGGSLLRVIHGSVDAKFLNRLRSGRGQCLANGEIRRCRALKDFRRGAARAGNAGIVHNPCRRDLACALSIEEIAGVDAIQQKSIAGVALAIGPDRLIAQSGVHTGAVG